MEVKKKNKKELRVESETFYRGNDRMQIKIYDKKRHLRDIGICSIKENVMRIEFVLKTSAKIKEAFGTSYIKDITNGIVTEYYMIQFRELFHYPYEKWKKYNGKLLSERIQYHKSNSMKCWQRNLLCECRNLELKNRVPIILDIENLLEQVKLLEKNGHYSRVKKGILNKCNMNDVYLQNDCQKIEKIIDKVHWIYKNMKKYKEDTPTSGEGIEMI